MFAAGNMTLANLYPITASLGMVGYRSSVSYTHLDVYKRQTLYNSYFARGMLLYAG